jgi:hypothetical protein
MLPTTTNRPTAALTRLGSRDNAYTMLSPRGDFPAIETAMKYRGFNEARKTRQLARRFRTGWATVLTIRIARKQRMDNPITIARLIA